MKRDDAANIEKHGSRIGRNAVRTLDRQLARSAKTGHVKPQTVALLDSVLNATEGPPVGGASTKGRG